MGPSTWYRNTTSTKIPSFSCCEFLHQMFSDDSGLLVVIKLLCIVI